jgi:CO/xanthine dehydrogenase FAD-binding subunit
VTGAVYVEPRTIDEAVAALAEHGPDARIVAGGTDLVVLARKRRAPLDGALIAIHRVDDLNGIEPLIVGGAAAAFGDRPNAGGLRIGAATPHAAIELHPAVIERFTALADGSALVGSPATRHVGTLGGNLANASPANETGSPLLIFDAQVELWSSSGVRNLAVKDLFVGPGQTALGAGELIVDVRLPSPDGAGPIGSAYIRLDYRMAMEIAVVGAAVMVRLDDDSPKAPIANARLALTAVAPTCVEVPGITDVLRGRDPNDPAAWDDVGRRAAEAAAPIDDVRAPADYRRAMIPVVVRRAFDVALRRARGEHVWIPATHHAVDRGRP